MNKQMVCLIGGTGFIGGYLTKALAELGFSVRIPTRKREKVKHDLIVLPTVEVVETDVTRPDLLLRVVDGADIVINLVGILHESSSNKFRKIHIDLPRALVDSCRKVNVSKIIHLSALGVSEKAKSAYLKSKWAGEEEIQLANESGLTTTIIRPSVVFGEGDSFVTLLTRLISITPVVAVIKPHAKFQPIFVEDLVQAIVKLIPSTSTLPSTLEFGGPETLTFKDITKIICEKNRKRRIIVPLTSGMSYLLAGMMEFLPIKILTRDNLLSLESPNTTTQRNLESLEIPPTSLGQFLEMKTDISYKQRRAAERRRFANR